MLVFALKANVNKYRRLRLHSSCLQNLNWDVLKLDEAGLFDFYMARSWNIVPTPPFKNTAL